MLETQGEELTALKEAAQSLLAPRADALVLQFEAKTGWLVSDLGRTWVNASLQFQVTQPEEAAYLASTWPPEQAEVHLGRLESVVEILENSNLRFDLILGKHGFALPQAAGKCLQSLQRLLLPGGELLWISNLAGEGTRLQDLLAASKIEDSLLQALREAEREIRASEVFQVGEADWEQALKALGLQQVASRRLLHQGQRWLTPARLQHWMNPEASPLGAALAARLSPGEMARLAQGLGQTLLHQPVPWQTSHHLLLAVCPR
ncbi:MAG: hypothetical protein A2535_03150 [Burkholderiales bacterium RIFOXYD2_FULL_59_8]|nr:MAG: hypothetical protein A2535_03150 [Burkholderiales bacterium RIFOXYD2_FULL_59_8]